MSKIIPGAALEACYRWDVPEIGAGRGADAPTASGLLTARQIEQIQKQAYEEGLALGKKDGWNAGQEQVRGQAQRLAALCQALSRPLEELDDQIVAEVAALALAIARHIIRREIRIDPGQVIAAVQGAIAELPVASRGIKLYLNPEDVVLVRDALAPPGGEAHTWQLIGDPLVARGGSRVTTENSLIDATVEKRLAAIAAQIIGGERGQDHDDR